MYIGDDAGSSKIHPVYGTALMRGVSGTHHVVEVSEQVGSRRPREDQLAEQHTRQDVASSHRNSCNESGTVRAQLT